MASSGCHHRFTRKCTESARNFILSPPFQAAVQFSVGTFIAGLFVFVRPISFPLSCLAALLLVVVVAVLSPDNHIGTRLMGSASLLGAMAWGLVLGGAVLSLVHVAVRSVCPSHVGCSAHTAMLCCLAVVVLAVLAVNRAAMGPPYPPHVWVAGMVSVLAFGLVLIAGQFVTHLMTLWTHVVGGLLLSCLVASGFSALVSFLVLPSLAMDEMRADTAAALRGLGHAASRFASRGLQREEPGCTSRPSRLHSETQTHPHAVPLPYRKRALVPTDGPSGGGGSGGGGGGGGPDGTEPQGIPPEAVGPPVGGGAGSGAGPSGGTGTQRRPSLNGRRMEDLPPSLRDPLKYDGSGAAAAAAVTLTFPVAAVVSLSGSPQGDPRVSDARERASRDPWDSAGSVLASAAAAATSGGGGGASHPSSAPTSDDERPAWPLHAMSRPRGGGGGMYGSSGDGGEFEHVMEDEDAFLRLLQEATAPQAPYNPAAASRRGRHRRDCGGPAAAAAAATRAPPPVVAPPGGILPSPSTRDLMGLGGAASVTVLFDSKSAAELSGDVSNMGGDSARDGGATTRPRHDAAGPPGSGGATAHGGGGAISSAVPWAPVSALRPLLARARTCLGAAAVEPPWMIRGPADLAAWSRVLAGCEALLSRVVSLECLLEDHRPGQHGHLLGDVSLAAVLGVDVVAPYRSVYAEVAASCATMSAAVTARMGGGARQAGFVAVGGWQSTKERLRSLVRTALSTYWSRMRADAQFNHLHNHLHHRHHHRHHHQQRDAKEAADVGADTPAAAAVVAADGTPTVGASADLQGGAVRRPPELILGDGGTEGPDPGPHTHPHPHPHPHHHLHMQTHSHIRLKIHSGHHTQPHAQPHGPHHTHYTQQQQAPQPTQQESQDHPQQRQQPYSHPTNKQQLEQQQLEHHTAGRHRAVKIRTVTLHQARAITFLWTVTEGIITALDELEAAVQTALAPSQRKRWPLVSTTPTAASPGGHASASAAAGAGGKAAPPPPPRPPLPPPPPQPSVSSSGENPSIPSSRETSGSGSPESSGNGGGNGGGDGDGDGGGASSHLHQSSPGHVPAATAAATRAALGDPTTGAATLLAHERVATGLGQPAVAASAAPFALQPHHHHQQQQQQKGGRVGAAAPPHHQQQHQQPSQGRQTHGSVAPHSTWLRSVGCSLADTAWELCQWAWAWPLVEITLGLPMLRYVCVLLASHFSNLALRGAAARRALLRQRLFQYGVKYWFVSAGTLCLILGLAARPEVGFMRRYPMLYAYIATSVSMTDRVESTLSRSALRAGGTLAGGLLGLWVMLIHDWADSPAGLLAIVTFVAFLTGCLATHRLLYGMYLTVGTLLSIVFCQYGIVPYCCSTPGSTLEMFAARVLSVLLGCTLPVLFSQAVLPWYTSDWALEIMAGAFLSSAKIVRRLYDIFFDVHFRAHVSSCGAGATAELLRQYGMDDKAEALMQEAALEGEEAAAASLNNRPGQAQGAPGGVSGGGGIGNACDRDTTGEAAGQKEGAAAESTCDQSAGPVAKVATVATKGEEAAATEAAAPATATRSIDGALASAASASAAAPVSVINGSAATAAALRAEVSGPLVAVQTSLMKDTTVWSRGIYSVPMIVPAVLRCALLLSDRLAALQLVVADTPPPVNGRLSGWAFERMVLPLHSDMEGVLEALDRVALATVALLDPNTAAVAAVAAASGRDGGDAAAKAPGTTWAVRASRELDVEAQQQQRGDHQKALQQEQYAKSGGAADRAEAAGKCQAAAAPPDSPAAAELRAAVHELHLSRLQIRQHIHDMRRAFHADVRSLEEKRVSYNTHPDDTVHVNSMLYALVKTLDKATALARTALEQRQYGSTGVARRWLSGWCGFSQQ